MQTIEDFSIGPYAGTTAGVATDVYHHASLTTLDNWFDRKRKGQRMNEIFVTSIKDMSQSAIAE